MLGTVSAAFLFRQSRALGSYAVWSGIIPDGCAVCDRSTRVILRHGSNPVGPVRSVNTSAGYPSMSFLDIAVLAMIAAMVAAFAVSLKWLSLRTPFRKASRR